MLVGGAALGHTSSWILLQVGINKIHVHVHYQYKCMCVCACMSACLPVSTMQYVCSPAQGILDVYRHALGQADLYGPTNFSSFLDKAIEFATGAVSQEEQNYYILMVITVSEQ